MADGADESEGLCSHDRPQRSVRKKLVYAGKATGRSGSEDRTAHRDGRDSDELRQDIGNRI